MGIYDWFLFAAALLPAIVLCVYIYRKDRVEKEPLGLLLKLFALGALSCYPAAYIEGVLIGGIDGVFADVSFYLYNLVKYFVGVALVEEGSKWVILHLFTRKNEAFNSLFDGLIYAIFVSLGFAALENVLYVLEYGFGNAVMRAILSVPGHMFFAVLMGYYYSIRHITQKANALELQLKQAGVVDVRVKPISTKKQLFYSILMPTLAHGIYNYCCTIGTALATVAFYAFVIFMYIYCFGKIRKMSRMDAPDGDYAKAILMRKHPALAEYIRTLPQEDGNA